MNELDGIIPLTSTFPTFCRDVFLVSITGLGIVLLMLTVVFFFFRKLVPKILRRIILTILIILTFFTALSIDQRCAKGDSDDYATIRTFSSLPEMNLAFKGFTWFPQSWDNTLPGIILKKEGKPQ